MSITPTADKKTADRYLGNVRTVQEAFAGIDKLVILDLLRRREVSTENDGLRARSYDGSGGSSASDLELTQTEAAALAGLPGDQPDDDEPDSWYRHNRPDPLQRAIDEALADIIEIARLTKRMHRRISVVRNAASKAKDGTTLDQCRCCCCDVTGVGDDRLRSGYCPTCHRAWCRDGRPGTGGDVGRLEWEAKRRALLSARDDDGDI